MGEQGPIGEAGGNSLYAFVNNDALDRVDPYGLAGWNVHFNEGPTPYWGGATKAVVPTVDASVASDSTCSKRGCFRLTVKSVDMDAWWWPGPSTASYFHEQMHVNDYKVWTYSPLDAYAKGKAGCYSQKQAECWQKVVTRYASMKFFHEGAYHTFVDRDFNPLWPPDWSTKSTMWSVFSTSMTLLQSWEAFCPTL